MLAALYRIGKAHPYAELKANEIGDIVLDAMRSNTEVVTKERDALREALRKVLAPYDVMGNFGGSEWGHRTENIKQARSLAYPNTKDFLYTPQAEWK